MRNVFLFPAALAAVAAGLPGAALATSTTCSTSVVCAEYVNSFSGGSGGVAIHGEANSGIGVRGTSVSNTGFYGASGSANYLAPGVEGESTNTSGADAGGAFGLAGLASGGTFPYFGVVGIGRHDGMVGETYIGAGGGAANVGVAGFDLTTTFGNAAIAGTTTNGTGGLFLANASGAAAPEIPVGVFGIAHATNPAGAIGVDAQSESFPLYAQNTATSASVELATSNALVYGQGTKGSFSVDNSGNERLSGKLTTSGGMYARTTGSSGTQRVAYGARTAKPQIEDVGEGTLVSGRALVPIDPDFADSIDMRHAYDVFLTPDGDCKGLYVAQRTPSGFIVRELQGGRSNLTFSYRLVAKPVDENGERLARVAAIAQPAHPLVPASNGGRGASLLSPEARVKQLLGPQGYAKLIAGLSRRIAGK